VNNKIEKVVDNIFKINFGATKSERAFVFTDNYSGSIKKIAMMVAEAGKSFTKETLYAQYPSTGCHAMEPPEKIWAEAYGDAAYAGLKRSGLLARLIAKQVTDEEIKEAERIVEAHKDDAVDIIIALPNFSTTHTRFRDMLNRICGARYASMPLFDEEMLAGPMCVDWEAMRERTENIAGCVSRYDNVEIETPNGTSLSFSKKGRNVKADTGIITGPGEFSNLPAGEAYLAPLEGTAHGRLVLEWAPTRKLNKSVVLHVENGLVTKVEGSGEYASVLEQKLSECEENRNIAELGIGTNDKASRPDNILESEKILGTIHIALGDNSSFGGKVRASFHQDFVFFAPSVALFSADGPKKILLKSGQVQDVI